MGHAVAEISPWVLRLDLVSGRALLWVVEVLRAGEAHPEVYLYLADRYWRLAAHCERRGRSRRAQRLAAKARHYLGDPLPPAAALAMPVPRRPSFTAAIGFRTDSARRRPSGGTPTK